MVPTAPVTSSANLQLKRLTAPPCGSWSATLTGPSFLRVAIRGCSMKVKMVDIPPGFHSGRGRAKERGPGSPPGLARLTPGQQPALRRCGSGGAAGATSAGTGGAGSRCHPLGDDGGGAVLGHDGDPLGGGDLRPRG